jgi:DNA-directed RNA polymerase specialized sigma24 family protein
VIRADGLQIDDREIRDALAAVERLTQSLPYAVRDDAVDRGVDAVRQAIERYDPQAATPFAVMAIAYIESTLNYLRRRAVPATPVTLNPSQAEAVIEPDTTPPPVVLPHGHELLPESLRVTLILHQQHGYSLTDTALLTGISVEGVRYRLHAAALRLGLTTTPWPSSPSRRHIRKRRA